MDRTTPVAVVVVAIRAAVDAVVAVAVASVAQPIRAREPRSRVIRHMAHNTAEAVAASAAVVAGSVVAVAVEVEVAGSSRNHPSTAHRWTTAIAP